MLTAGYMSFLSIKCKNSITFRSNNSTINTAISSSFRSDISKYKSRH